MKLLLKVTIILFFLPYFASECSSLNSPFCLFFASAIQNQNRSWADQKIQPQISPKCFSCSTHTRVMIKKSNFFKTALFNFTPPPTLIPSEAIPARLTFNLGDSPIFQIFSKNFGEI